MTSNTPLLHQDLKQIEQNGASEEADGPKYEDASQHNVKPGRKAEVCVAMEAWKA